MRLETLEILISKSQLTPNFDNNLIQSWKLATSEELKIQPNHIWSIIAKEKKLKTDDVKNKQLHLNIRVESINE